MVRSCSPILCQFCLFLALIVPRPAIVEASALPDGQAFQALVAADLASGQLTAEEALLLRFQFGFASAELPPRYQVVGFSPLSCATDLVAEYYSLRPDLTNDTISRIDTWLLPAADKSQYLSPNGHFRLAYSLTGVDAVSALDVSPANGIPDFVERAALYCDRSWTVEVDSLGFAAPAGAVYEVAFESMQYYGYTVVVDPLLGTTRIVLHNSYLGFPANDDPDGNEAGAAKVTVAHEFKHASQYATSGWSEGGWDELDATWMEDVVYDQVNDYYNYLTGESPLRRPEIPLDGGTNTTGSYEDCVWQTYLSETWGVAVIQDFWARRALLPLEGVMESYRAVLNSRGTTLAGAWAEFTAWNYGVGERAVAGLGYEEGASYPAGPVVDTAVMYPFVTSGRVEHLAAQSVRLTGFSPTDNSLLRVVVAGEAGTGPLTLAVHVTRRDGTGQIETVDLDAGNDADYLLSVPVRDIAAAAVIVGNAATVGPAGDWDLTLALVPVAAQPAATVDRAAVAASLPEGAQGQFPVQLTNSGEQGSLLAYSVQLWTTDPGGGGGTAPIKSIGGSSFTCARTSYLAGQLLNLDFTVSNGSVDDEWLTGLSLDFPAGVSVLVASDFRGGSLGDLVSDNSVGDGAVISWHGVYGAQEYGVVRVGESASGTVQILAQAGFAGPLDIGWTVSGDSYGTTPHQLTGTISLAEESPQLSLQAPNGGEVFAVGDVIVVSWATGGSLPEVDLQLSRNDGQSWTTVAESIPNSGNYQLTLSGPPSNNCRLRVTATGGGIGDAGDNSFSLYEVPTWATATPVNGLLTAGQYEDIVVTLNTIGLATGDYNTWVVLAHNDPVGRTAVPVHLTVTAALSAVPEAQMFALHGAYPNPFNPRTAIAFELPEADETTVDVLDVRGYRIRRLLTGRLPAGSHELIWDGQDEHGQGVSAGVYLVRMHAGVHTGTIKILLAK